MKFKTLALFSGILVLAAVAAFAVNRWMADTPSLERVGQPLMTDVDPAQVRRIEIVSTQGTVTLTSEDGTQWRVAEQHDFPVDARKIKDLLVKLTSEKLAHRVTEDPGQLAALGLLTREENGGELEQETTGRVLRLYGEGEQPLFSLLVGNNRQGQGMMTFGGVYVRYPGDSTAYLIGESVLTEFRPQDWIDTVVLDVDQDEMLKAIRIEREGQRTVQLTRGEPGGDWRLEGMPPAALDQNQVSRVAGQLAGLEAFRIAAPDAPPAQLGRERTGRVQFEFFDKRRFTMEIGEAKADDDFRYVTIQAALPPGVDDAELRRKVEAFNARFGDRRLGVYDWDGKRMLQAWSEFRKDEAS